ncbi:hypothetical protein NEOLEDRAFT_598528 [Neolentinus lepideus HHB14362 ss-1]|uniref:Uncharacterized protein n=1 Tax=Neolentinus lepideus HHB14362 ss-1 TaxID=1314782 RepID=A0A165VAT6_9AGAM|nr:hypothetical protein NEOLEDRAFT_598528 [Neolentinus lepideus HHB14362 ss-1]
MLSNDSTSTPRPRPPAKVRRTVSGRYKDTPPPPYAPAVAFPTDVADLSDTPLDTILGSPISMTAQRVRLLSGTSPDLGAMPSPVVEEWMNERSKEELSELLLKADRAIKDRENELGLTSAVCKNLYQENVSLKSQHDALLARLPPSQPISPIGSPSPFSAPSLPLSASSTLSRTHNRRISVTPSEITRLADQNAELMLSLEKLETESAQADQAGKRRLRKLEKEIRLLKEELECTQARSQELEENAVTHEQEDDDEEVREAKRREREEKVKAVRKGTVHEEEEGGEVRDFAPGGALSAGSTPNVTPSARRIRRDFTFPPRSSSPSSSPTRSEQYSAEEQEDEDIDAFASNASYFTRPGPQPSPESLHESALISQLLLKIRELEQTNAHIVEQQAEATGRMRAAQRDVEQIKRLYECLGDGEVVLEDEGTKEESEGREWGKTIRFRSLRKSIVSGVPPRLDLGEFERGIGEDMHSTNHVKMRHRKSVVGLFGEDPTTPTSREFSITIAGSSPPRHFDEENASPIPSEAPLPDTNLNLSFPGSEAIDISADVELDRGARHTLGSELGDEWDGPSGGSVNHHLRTTSLYGLSELSLDLRDESGNSLVSPSPSDQVNASATIPRPETSSKRDSLRLRNRLLSQTVRARTSQWVDGRFKGTLLSQPDPSSPSSPGSSAPLGLRRQPSSTSTIMPPLSRTASLSRFIEGAVGTVFGPASNSTPETRPSSPTLEDELEEVAEKSVLKTDEEKKGVVAVVLDLWLWLQFIIIILVFLWAMAKRGPRNVLEEAERRRVGAGAGIQKRQTRSITHHVAGVAERCAGGILSASRFCPGTGRLAACVIETSR